MRNSECGVRNVGARPPRPAGSHALRGNPSPRRSASQREVWERAIAGIPLLLAASLAAADDKPDFSTQTLRGRVVFFADAMEKQTGVRAVPEARERVLALETTAGDLVPLVEDVRGRAFRRDERLRQMDVELVVRRYRQSPLVQILRVYEVTKDGRYEIDYWCDVCAIAMFENTECDCCQGPVDLRRRKVD
jgi:hypothetical protein